MLTRLVELLDSGNGWTEEAPSEQLASYLIENGLIFAEDSKINYAAIFDRYMQNLNCEINNEKDPFRIAFAVSNYGKEYFKDEDFIESRGFYKGLRVAREMLERVVALWKEENDFEEKE